jgi:hypothetical protein
MVCISIGMHFISSKAKASRIAGSRRSATKAFVTIGSTLPFSLMHCASQLSLVGN